MPVGHDSPDHPPPVGGESRPASIDHRRLASPSTTWAFVAAFGAAIGLALGAVVIGRVADSAAWSDVAWLAGCVVTAALLDTVGRVLWSAVVDRAEGQLRTDLLDTVMHQPLAELSEQAVGEILDRIDDDTHELGTLLRVSAWRLIRLAFAALPLLVVAGLTWWPSWFLMPIVAATVFAAVRSLLSELARRRVIEEAAWTDHAAAMEEAIAARDDLRTSLGQPYAVRRLAELSAVIHDRMGDVADLEARILRRSGLILHVMLAAVAGLGVLLASEGHLEIAALVTLFAVTVNFVGQIDQVAHHLPDLQAGVGALIRLRAVMAAEVEPTGGRRVPDGALSVEFRDLHFAYDDGTFALDGISFAIPAGTTCALVGRSGSGKSTLSSLVSRAVEPERGSVFLGGVDVVDLDLDALRGVVGLVTQRTEIIAGTVAQNIALFADVEEAAIRAAVEELGLGGWIDGLPEGLDTMLGPAGTTLSAGEEQLVAFARLLVRDVRVIVLDEATARMDPVTEAQVVSAAGRLLAGRTGILVAHRLGTIQRADTVAVLEAGRLVELGERERLAEESGAYRRLLDAASRSVEREVPHGAEAANPASRHDAGRELSATRRSTEPPPAIEIDDAPPLRRGALRAVLTRPEWGLLAVAMFGSASALGAYGMVTNWTWGRIIEQLEAGGEPDRLVGALVVGLLVAPFAMAGAVRRFPHWWIAVLLRVRMAVLVGQTDQRRLPATPPGEVVARAMDSDRYARYGDRWFDVTLGAVFVVVTAVLGGTVLAGAVLLAIMVLTAATSALGSPAAGRTAAAASSARADFGRSLVSSLDAIRTVKLSAATSAVHEHLRRVDGGRIDAAVREHRIQSILDGVPVVLVQSGVVAAWAMYAAGWWDLSTALLVSGVVIGFEWFGRVAGSVITEAPGTRAWQRETSRLAGGGDLMDLPAGVDLVAGVGMIVDEGNRETLEHLKLTGLSAVHDDGTLGVSDVNLSVERGETVLLLGRIGSGKSTLLAALAGLVSSTGSLRWNGTEIDAEDREAMLRPGRVAFVSQQPRLLSGSFADNIELDHGRALAAPVQTARLERDIADAGGTESLVGHRGVRLSGGQVQRLALARALAIDAELLVVDDVSSALDAATEVELWEAMRSGGRTVIGATSKRAALERADRVVVLVDGVVAADGAWSDLAPTWASLAG